MQGEVSTKDRRADIKKHFKKITLSARHAFLGAMTLCLCTAPMAMTTKKLLFWLEDSNGAFMVCGRSEAITWDFSEERTSQSRSMRIDTVRCPIYEW